MSRAHRLLDLIQVLCRHRRPVSGGALAEALGVSIRTLYRDIDALRAQGAQVDGEAGVGYVLRGGFMLPPLMFTEDEIEALVLGSRWVAQRADGPLGEAAHSALVKIATVLPDDLVRGIEGSGLLVAPGGALAGGDEALTVLRGAIRSERKLRIAYADEGGAGTARVVWPVLVGFYDRARVLVAWCELREAFRHFRLDRITTLETTDERYPRRRAVLFGEWRALRGVPEP